MDDPTSSQQAVFDRYANELRAATDPVFALNQAIEDRLDADQRITEALRSLDCDVACCTPGGDDDGH